MKRSTLMASLALAAMTSSLAAGGAFVAQAAEVRGAITNVNIVQTQVGSYDQVRVNVTWALPAGTQAGDTWTLTLPQELSALNGTSFPLKDPANGAVLATAVIRNGVVTFTATNAVTGLQNVNGTAFFMASRANATATNVPVNVVFTSNDGTSFPDTIQFNGTPGTNTTTETYKWGAADNVNTLQWGIYAPRPAAGGQVITFTDEIPADAGYTLSCNPTDLTLWGDPDGQNGPIGPQWIADNSRAPGFNGFTVVSCSPTKIVVKYTVQASHQWGGTYWQPLLRLTRSTTTDKTTPAWKNDGTVQFDANPPVPVHAVVSNTAAGGNGTGDFITLQKYTGTLATGDYDEAPGLEVEGGATTPVTILVRNEGMSTLRNVVIRDTTDAGARLQDLTCTFPDGTTVGADAEGTVTWGGSLPLNATATCTGTLPPLPYGEPHQDTATVTATGSGPVSSSDTFHARNSQTPPPPPDTPTATPTDTPTETPTSPVPTEDPTPTDTITPTLPSTTPPETTAPATPPETTTPSTPPATTQPPTTTPPATTQPPTMPPVTTAPPTTTPVPPVTTTTPVPPVTTPPAPPATTPPSLPPVKMKTLWFQVDRYYNPTWVLARKAVAYDDDGFLKIREDRGHWGHSSYQVLSVRVPQNASKAQIMRAINAKTNRFVGDVATSSKTTRLKKGQALTVAWRLQTERGAKPIANSPLLWGPKGNLHQVFFARS